MENGLEDNPAWKLEGMFGSWSGKEAAVARNSGSYDHGERRTHSNLPWTSFRGRDPLTAWTWGRGKGGEGERRIQDDS